MGEVLVQRPDESFLAKYCYGFTDDFDHLVTGDRWTVDITDTGSACAVADGARGIATLGTGTTDNNEVYLFTTYELFKLLANKPLWFEAYIQYAEAATNVANVIVGLVDGVADDLLVDDGAGPKATHYGAFFYKVDGGLNWHVENSNGARSRDGVVHVAGSASYQRLGITWMPRSSSAGDFSFFINDNLVMRHENQSYSSATDLDIVFGLKQGSATAEALLVDYVSCYQVR
jgi:hypothetical protein